MFGTLWVNRLKNINWDHFFLHDNIALLSGQLWVFHYYDTHMQYTAIFADVKQDIKIFSDFCSKHRMLALVKIE